MASISTPSCASLIRSATTDLTQHKIPDAVVKPAIEERENKIRWDGATFGAKYLLRHCRRAFREGRWAAGVGAAAALPVPTVAAAATAVSVCGMGLNIVGAGLADACMNDVPSNSALRKSAAEGHLQSAVKALHLQLAEAAKALLESGELAAEDIKQLAAETQSALIAFTRQRQLSHDRLKYSKRLTRQADAVTRETNNIYDALTRAAVKLLVTRLGSNRRAILMRVSLGELDVPALDHISAQWDGVCRWVQNLPEAVRPSAEAMQRYTYRVQRQLSIALALVAKNA